MPVEDLYANITYADGSRESGRRLGKVLSTSAAKPEVEDVGDERDEVEGGQGEGRKRKQRMSESSASSEDDILKTKLEGLKDGRRRSVLRRLHLRKS